MFSFKNNEGVKKSSDLHESGKKVVAKTNEKVFEHLLLDGEEPVRKLLPVEDSDEEVVNDGCHTQLQTMAVKITNLVTLSDREKVAKRLLNDKTFFSRAVYEDDNMDLVWIVQKTNNLNTMRWMIEIAYYLNKRYGLWCTFDHLSDYWNPLDQWRIRHFQPITHVEYFTYLVGEQNAHAHVDFPDNQNEGKNNVSN